MNQPIIRLQGVEKRYVNGDVVTPALNGVTLDIQAGEYVALMGPSGSGKSTLMHIMGFLDHPTSGTYIFDGQDVSAFEEDKLAQMRRDRVGFVFQAFNLLPKTSVIENVSLPMVYSGVWGKERMERAMQAITEVGLTHRVNHLSSQLSGGEKQRVAIARAIVNNPAVIFADEPTGNLDTKSGTDVLNLLADMNARGRTIVMVTHETEAAEYAKRIVRMRDGAIISDDSKHARRSGGYHK
jgi:putative ABC transport system ATP-binding protein